MGFSTGSTIGEDEVKSLATLPPADVLRGQLVSAVAGPLTTVVGLFTAPLRDLVNVLDARIKQLEEQGETVPEPQAEAQAEEVTEEVTPEAPAEEAPAAEEAAAAEEEPVAEEAPEAEATPDEADSAEAEQASAETVMAAKTDTDKVVEQLGGMTVLELVELKNKLEEEWGVTAAAPMAVAAPAAAGVATALPRRRRPSSTSSSRAPAARRSR